MMEGLSGKIHFIAGYLVSFSKASINIARTKTAPESIRIWRMPWQKSSLRTRRYCWNSRREYLSPMRKLYTGLWTKRSEPSTRMRAEWAHKSRSGGYDIGWSAEAGFSFWCPHKKCVINISEIPVSNGKMYVPTIFECFDLSVFGLAMGTSMKADLCTQTFGKDPGCLFHWKTPPW